MTKVEMQGLYEQSCNRCKSPPDPSEFRAWWNVLGMFAVEDVQSAIDEWREGSRFMPAAKELLSRATPFRSRRVDRTSQRSIFAAWQCEVCKVTRSGFITAQDRTVRDCPGIPRRIGGKTGDVCGGRLREVHREAPAVEAVPLNVVSMQHR